MRVKCRAFFEANSHDQIGFYGMPGEPQRRIKNGQEFWYFWDEENPPVVKEREVTVFDIENGKEVNHRQEVKNFIGRWIEVLEIPRKKPGPKPKNVDQHILNA